MPNDDLDIAALLDESASLPAAPEPQAPPQETSAAEVPPPADDDFADMLAAVAPAESPAPPPAAPPPMPPVVAEDDDDFAGMLDGVAAAPPPPAAAPVVAALADDEGADPADFMAAMGIQQQREVPDITKPWMKFHKFVRVTKVEEVEAIVEEALTKTHKCSLDLETEGLDNRIVFDGLGNPNTVHQIVGYCLSTDGVTGYYVPVRHKNVDGGPDLNVSVAGVNAAIKRLCLAAQPKANELGLAKDALSFKEEFFAEKPKVTLYFWNAQFDQEFLYPVTGIDWWHPDAYEDGMLAYFCKHAADKAIGLKYKAPEILRDPEGNVYTMIELKELFIRGRPIRFDTLSPDEPGVIKYGCSDAICTFLLCDRPRPHEKGRQDIIKFAKAKCDFTYRLEKQVSQAVRAMERNRVKINRARVREILEEHARERAEILEKIHQFAGSKGWNALDPNSPKQLSDFLFGDGPNCLNISVTPSNDYPGGKPPRNEKSGQFKTDAETLEGMVKDNPHAPPVLRWIVEFRGVEKVIGTYLSGMANNPDENDQLRFAFKQTGAGTGRFSAPANDPDQGYSGIPIHGIPSESTLRKVFYGRDEYTIAKCDYAGQELRIAANVSGEPVWVKEFLEGDGDLHSITARAFFGKQDITKDERKMGKIANFALIYGGGPQAIIRATGCDRIEASRRKSAFDKAVPVFAGWIKKQHAAVKKDLGITTAFGRWLAIPDANHVDKAVQAACERYSTNYPIQGAGADIMKISMVLLHKEFHKRGWLRNGGDDSVRMLLTVHDEIVFEIKHARVTEAIPIIVDIMESPTKMARWRVPLVVEPLIGPNWGSGYKCERAKKGYQCKPDEMLIGGFIYSNVRKAEKGDKSGLGEVDEGEGDKRKIRFVDPPWLRGKVSDAEGGPVVEAPQEKPVDFSAKSEEPTALPVAVPTAAVPVTPALAPAAPKLNGASNGTTNGKSKIVTMKISRLSKHTVKQVSGACSKHFSRDGKLLRLTDPSGAILIDPSLGVRVNPQTLAAELFELNLGDGEFVEDH